MPSFNVRSFDVVSFPDQRESRAPSRAAFAGMHCRRRCMKSAWAASIYEARDRCVPEKGDANS